jgi:GntR family transcriptional regulator
VIDFRLVPGSGVSTYLQIVQQVKHAVRWGLLRPGDQLPTVREVVSKLAINPNTVLKAYRELDREGLVSSRPGQGTFVTVGIPGSMSQSDHVPLRRALERWLRNALDAGLDRESVMALFQLMLEETYTKEGVA